MNREQQIVGRLRMARALVETALDLTELHVDESGHREKEHVPSAELIPSELHIARARRALRDGDKR